MRTLLTVFFKEILDNVRDRRTLVSALIMGPIFGPVMFAFVINLSIDRALDDAETTMELPVIGQWARGHKRRGGRRKVRTPRCRSPGTSGFRRAIGRHDPGDS